ncbi:hypothetical protein OO184_21305 [Photorhabdus sp. APURE]|uniref:hypothetical protein n=1 Tax=Photorhabdus aballayi TaxID=2991723 RepID=UPI00223DD4A3|nr:hypothetical protein [Photorhabdus aballayi]MCW7550399.1 hypothetical protein [Photorhabdus aballayi]
MKGKSQKELRAERLRNALQIKGYETDCDVDLPEYTQSHTTGFIPNASRLIGLCHNRVEDAVIPVWSEYTRHGTGDGSDRSRGSHGGIVMHSSRKRALMALRSEIEMKMAALLADLDDAIVTAED